MTASARGAIAPFRFAGAVWCATLLSIFQAHMRHRSAIQFQVIARSPSPRKPPGRADGLICVNPSALSFIGSCQWRNPRVTTRSVVSGS